MHNSDFCLSLTLDSKIWAKWVTPCPFISSKYVHNVWCIKNRTKLSNVLLQCLVRFLMHQTLVLDLSIKFWTRTKINFCYWISHSETMFKTIWTGPKTFWTYRRRKHHTLLGSQSEWPKDQILFILGWYKLTSKQCDQSVSQKNPTIVKSCCGQRQKNEKNGNFVSGYACSFCWSTHNQCPCKLEDLQKESNQNETAHSSGGEGAAKPVFASSAVRNISNLCTVPLGDWPKKRKVSAIIIKQQFGFPMSTT